MGSWVGLGQFTLLCGWILKTIQISQCGMREGLCPDCWCCVKAVDKREGCLLDNECMLGLGAAVWASQQDLPWSRRGLEKAPTSACKLSMFLQAQRAAQAPGSTCCSGPQTTFYRNSEALVASANSSCVLQAARLLLSDLVTEAHLCARFTLETSVLLRVNHLQSVTDIPSPF